MPSRGQRLAFLTGAGARRVAGSLALLALVAWATFAWLRHRAMALPPPPAAGPLRTTVLARGIQPGSSVVVDADSVWFQRRSADAASIISVPKAGGPERARVDGERGVRLAGADDGHVYYLAKRPFQRFPSVPVEDVDQLLRVPQSGGAPAPVPGACGQPGVRFAWADASGVYCEASGGAFRMVRTEAQTGATLWSVSRGGGERWSFARGAGRLYVSITTARMGSCGGPLFSVDLDTGKLAELMDVDCPAPLAADATGLYVGTGYEGGGYEIHSPPLLRVPPSRFGTTATVARPRVDSLAVTPYHVVWGDARAHQVRAARKGGGGEVVLAPVSGVVTSDATAVYVATEGGELLRIDGLD